MAKQEPSRPVKVIREMADGMRRTGIIDDGAHAKVTMRRLG